MSGDDFGQRRPRSACGAVAVVPAVQRGAKSLVVRREERPLKRVDERARGKLGDEPDEIRGEAAMDGARSDSGLIAGERRRSAANSRPSAPRRSSGADVVGGFAGAALSQRLAELEQRRASAGRPAAESAPRSRPASRAQLGGQVAGRQRKPRQRRLIDQVSDRSTTSPRRRFWSAIAGSKSGRVARMASQRPGRGGQSGVAAGRRERDMGHRTPMV